MNTMAGGDIFRIFPCEVEEKSQLLMQIGKGLEIEAKEESKKKSWRRLNEKQKVIIGQYLGPKVNLDDINTRAILVFLNRYLEKISAGEEISTAELISMAPDFVLLRLGIIQKKNQEIIEGYGYFTRSLRVFVNTLMRG